jgi:hypothetical protein
VSPVTITAKETARVYCFTVAQFEAVAGPIRDVFSQAILGRPSVLKPMSFITDTAIAAPQVSSTDIPSMTTVLCQELLSFSRMKLEDYTLKECQRAARIAVDLYICSKASSVADCYRALYVHA